MQHKSCIQKCDHQSISVQKQSPESNSWSWMEKKSKDESACRNGGGGGLL